tara:strand:- start:150067 stop:150837 length:771 start_codon:yes stop_codon:yes gene_type:complete
VFVVALATTVGGVARADVVTLYDDGLGNLPGDQPWVGYFALGGMASESPVAAGTRLTTNDAASAGYSNHAPLSNPIVPQVINPLFPSLNDTVGFSLSFQLQVFDESHLSNDRAGFSVILLGQDSRGIEIGFWEDRVFAQTDSPLFTHGEEGLFDTTADETTYTLTIQSGGYALAADTQTILSGAVRDYSSFSGTPLGVPYTLGNYVFLGDDTTSASADVSIGSVVLNSSLAAVPEPSTFAFVALLATPWGLRRRRG